MMYRHIVIMPILLVAVVIAAVPPAAAVLLPPATTIPAIPIAAPGGTQLASVYYASQGAADLLANVSSAVFRNTAGTLDFYYQVTNISPGPTFDEVHRLTGSSFAGSITNAWWVVNGAAVACSACPGGFFQNGTQNPLNIDRSNSGGLGSVVGFNFPLGFEVGSNPPETSVVLLIQTNATTFEPGFVSVIDSGSITRFAFEPAALTTVPEPGALVLLGIGMLGTGVARWRRRQA